MTQTTLNAETCVRPSDERCVFLIGCDRSGTTLLRSILNRHPQLGITYEAPSSVMLSGVFDHGGYIATIDAMRTFPQYDLVNWADVRDVLVELDDVTLADTVAAAHRSQIGASEMSIWGDKTPAYTRFIDVLASMYPNSVFVHIVRDPRAVALSWIATDWGPNTPLHAGREWSKRVGQAIDGFEHLAESRFITARYEDLIADPDEILATICHLIGIEYNHETHFKNGDADDCLPGDYFKRLHSRCGKNMDSTRLNRWRSLDERAIKLIEAGTWHLMQRFGYEPTQSRQPIVTTRDVLLSKAENRIKRALNNCRRRMHASDPTYPMPS